MEQYTPAFPIEVVCSPKAIRCPLLGCPPGGRIGPRSLHRPKRLTGASASYTTQPLKAVAHFRGKPTEHLKEEFMRFSAAARCGTSRSSCGTPAPPPPPTRRGRGRRGG